MISYIIYILQTHTQIQEQAGQIKVNGQTRGGALGLGGSKSAAAESVRLTNKLEFEIKEAQVSQ